MRKKISELAEKIYICMKELDVYSDEVFWVFFPEQSTHKENFLKT